jgi:hypothetical protein
VVDLGRSLVVLGVVLVAVGLVLTLAPRIPWLGRLPGDIHIERDHVSFHFPLVTCLVVSAIATLVLNLLSRK